LENLIKKRNRSINLKEYKLLCKACDKILLMKSSTKETYAIPFLHVIREHPFILKRYSNLFDKKNNFSLFYNRIKNLVLVKLFLLNSLIKKNKFDDNLSITNKKIDILFVSHLLNHSQIGSEKDFYFGNIPNDLKKNGYNSLISLINHSGREVDYLSEQWSSRSKIPRIILSKSLDFLNEIKIIINVSKESLRLFLFSKKQDSKLKKNLFIKSSQECLSHRSIINLRISFQIKKIISKYNPKILIITHEGHSYERLIFFEARKYNKDIKCIGYQHAIIFKFQHAICRNLKQNYNPDVILTSGKIGYNKLIKINDLKKVSIRLLGSNKSTNKIIKNKINNKCLVIPEGILEECFLLFEFSIQCALKNPDSEFIWRLHPGIKFSSIKKKIDFDKLPNNITISNNNLNVDLKECTWALYRGTTTIIEGVYSGLRPIYLELPNEINIDPLIELKLWHESISNSISFKKIIKNSNSNKWSKKNWLKATKYCNNFFDPLNMKVLIKTLKEN
tara:strand:+ start:31116 stop:32630 length:1515 start_codon:yes stop_codon:yes gene_type:complete